MVSIAQISKYSGWLLVILILVYVATGFSHMGYFGFDTIIDPQFSYDFHSDLYVVTILLVLVILHCCTRFFYALKNRMKRPEIPKQPVQPQQPAQPPPQQPQQPVTQKQE